jgi:hypothetical protein
MKIREVFVLTGEVIDRDATAEELEQREIDTAKHNADLLAKEAEAEAKATQKAALLERLGISEDEARLLLA